ncbi:MAG: hypothetical protein AAGG50_16780 [Bacteroidota bacterium]
MLLSFAFAMLAGATSPDSVAAMHGVWVNDSTHTVTHTLSTEGDGRTLTQTIYYRHLVVSDSVLTETTVWEDDFSEKLQAATTVTRYEDEGAQLRLGDVLVDVAVEEDRLVTSSAYGSTTYRRGEPTETPVSLFGTWIGYVTDNAGVTIDLAFVFSEEGTLRVGFGDPTPFRVLNDYLLFAENQVAMDTPTGHVQAWEVARYEVIGPDRIDLVMADGGTTPLVRMRPQD